MHWRLVSKLVGEDDGRGGCCNVVTTLTYYIDNSNHTMNNTIMTFIGLRSCIDTHRPVSFGKL